MFIAEPDEHKELQHFIFFFFLFYVGALCGLTAVLKRDPASLEWNTHAAFNQKRQL